jgi:scyllo-inositol 2-dehydrogenase (NADP+)
VSPSLRVAIAGYGLAGEVFHAPLVRAVSGLEVAAIVTTDAARQERARSAFPQAAIVEHVDEVWEGLDLLVVATPNRAHVELGLAAVKHGVAVVVDKPLASTVAEAEHLLSAGGRVTVFQNRRWDGDFMTASCLVRENALGEVQRFESRFERFRPQFSGDAWRERPQESEGGGLLLDLGAHLVDQARELFGAPLRVYAELDRRRPGAQVDDDVFLALEHPHGVRSHLMMSATAPLAGPRLRVSGLAAGFQTFGLDPQEAQLAAGLAPGDPDYGLGRPGSLEAGEQLRAIELERGAYERFYEGVVRWLRDDAPPPVDPRDSLAGLRVLEAARESTARRSIIEMEETQ